MTAPAPLLLTIRFSTSIPDIDLDILYPRTTTVLSLKHILRERISTKNRLRLIHQGRLLPDSYALAAVLKVPPPPPPSTSPPPSIANSTSNFYTAGGREANTQDDSDGGKGKGKGKAVRNDPPPRIYIICSVSDDALSPSQLHAESLAAAEPPAGSTTGVTNTTAKTADDHASGLLASTQPPPSVRPRPKGFDRLLQSGFTSSEVSTLRTQFASIHADRFDSADSPPSPDTLRRLEDAWIDSNAGEALPSLSGDDGAGGGSSGAGTGAGLDGGGDDFAGMATMLDVLIKGMIIGFFFPLGSMTWLLRESPWGNKWQVFVGSGVVLSLTVGLIMGISGDQ